ncbi:hypothetical protein FDP41_013571 [Naegleria fowleri]|uniref:PKD/REJ-like domain-containing protein n=1 Tax=Naegleria fowleri TaxID=5763 RepID=A0A6A5BT50_NAEFO|nr:uncharacterized protein FDP41_013571 [Naegleria fowleri]KAF0980357.1 hypothetical protein FDP41_013571 [Naegleria fowleri]CAG4716691.1 unnamed protein product [Naegleria fowleri]
MNNSLVVSSLAIFLFACWMANISVVQAAMAPSAPSITVVSTSPQTYEIKYTDDVIIEVAVGNDLMINWTINGTAIEYYNTTLIFPVSHLQEEVPYLITLTVTDLNTQMSSTYDHPFIILKSPRFCTFNVTPISGVAFETEFSHVLENCKADHLRYSYFIETKEGVRDVHHENVSSQIVRTTLPFANQSSVTVGVEVIDSLTETSTIYTYPVEVVVPALASFNDCKFMVRHLGFKRSARSLPAFKYSHIYTPQNIQLTANECARRVKEQSVSV